MVIQAERKVIDRRQVSKLVKAFGQKLSQEQIPYAHLFLFGSYAHGNPHPDSDIDVAVVVPTALDIRMKKKLSSVAWIAKQVHVKLEPHVLSTKDFQNRFLSLPAEVKKHGVRVR